MGILNSKTWILLKQQLIYSLGAEEVLLNNQLPVHSTKLEDYDKPLLETMFDPKTVDALQVLALPDNEKIAKLGIVRPATTANINAAPDLA